MITNSIFVEKNTYIFLNIDKVVFYYLLKKFVNIRREKEKRNSRLNTWEREEKHYLINKF